MDRAAGTSARDDAEIGGSEGRTGRVEIRAIEQVENIETLHLSRVDGAFVLRLLGKNGDPHADRPINVSIKHKDFKEQIQLSLETDKDGRAVLECIMGIFESHRLGGQRVPMPLKARANPLASL